MYQLRVFKKQKFIHTTYCKTEFLGNKRTERPIQAQNLRFFNMIFAPPRRLLIRFK